MWHGNEFAGVHGPGSASNAQEYPFSSNMQQAAAQVGPAEVAVFWDYENIHIPYGYSAAKTSDAIRTKVLPFGRIVDRKLYYDSSRHSERGDFLRSELDSSGFTLVDCPNRNTKETLDKKLIVDVLFFAWERVSRGAKACVVLITCDGDYSYTLARLWDIGVLTVIIARPNGVAKVLKENADVAIRWCDDVLVRQDVEEETPTFRRKMVEVPTFQRKVKEAPTNRKYFEEASIFQPQVKEAPTFQKKFEKVPTIQKHFEETSAIRQHVEFEAPSFRQYVEDEAPQVEEAVPIRMQVDEAPATLLRQQIEDAPKVEETISTTIHPRVAQPQPVTYLQVAQAPFTQATQQALLPCGAKTPEHKHNNKSSTYQQEAKFELLAKFLECVLRGQEQASAVDGGSLSMNWATESTIAEEFYKQCGVCDQDVKRHGLEGKYIVVRCDDDDEDDNDNAGKSTTTYLQLTLKGFEFLGTHCTISPLAQEQPTIHPLMTQAQPATHPRVAQAPTFNQITQQSLLPCGAKTSENKHINNNNYDAPERQAKLGLLAKFLECVLNRQRAMDGGSLHTRWAAEGTIVDEFYKQCGGYGKQNCNDVRLLGLKENFMIRGRRLLGPSRQIVRCDDDDSVNNRAGKSNETYLQLTPTGFAFLRIRSTTGEGGTQA